MPESEESGAVEVDVTKTPFELALEMQDVPIDLDGRLETLEVDVNSLSVHVVKGVRILAASHDVSWSQYTERNISGF